MDVVEFAAVVLTLRTRFPFSVTSWGRTHKRNAAVGGNPNSRHLTFEAVDVVLDNPNDDKEMMSTAQRLGLKVVNEKDCIHLQTP